MPLEPLGPHRLVVSPVHQRNLQDQQVQGVCQAQVSLCFPLGALLGALLGVSHKVCHSPSQQAGRLLGPPYFPLREAQVGFQGVSLRVFCSPRVCHSPSQQVDRLLEPLCFPSTFKMAQADQLGGLGLDHRLLLHSKLPKHRLQQRRLWSQHLTLT